MLSAVWNLIWALSYLWLTMYAAYEGIWKHNYPEATFFLAIVIFARQK